MLKGLFRQTIARIFHPREAKNPLAEGITLRPVLLHETLIFYCTICGVQHQRPSRDAGIIVEIWRTDGRLYAFPDSITDTNCTHCHNPTPFPLLCTNELVARQLARTIDPTADYEFVRLEPRKE